MASDLSTLEFVNVFAGYGARPVLRDVSLRVEAGEVLALVGPNGAGKSTLVRAASGVILPSAGRVLLDGFDLARLKPDARARRTATVPQAARLPDAFTVGQTVLMGRTPYLPLWASESHRDCEVAWAAMVQAAVEPLADRRVDELSGGEVQRVLIARALAQEPGVLLMDEATAHLDLKHQMAMLDLVRRLAGERGLAVLVTLHDLNQAALYADRLALLIEGRIAATGCPDEVLTSEQLSAAYGTRVSVSRHPVHGTPLVAPERLCQT